MTKTRSSYTEPATMIGHVQQYRRPRSAGPTRWRARLVCALVLAAAAAPAAQAPPGGGQGQAVVTAARADIARGRYTEARGVLSTVAAAQPTSEAALELGLLELYLGRRAEADRRLRLLVNRLDARTAAAFFRLARAATALGAFQDANDFFRDANRQAPDDPSINAAWGALFLAKHNPGDAMKSFQEALRVDANHVPALLGAARVSLGTNPPGARKALEHVLELDGNNVEAHLLLAELALDDRKRDDARAFIQKALAVNPNSLEARSLDAAMAFLEGRTADFERDASAVLAINPVYGEVYRVAGDHLARNYRFDEAVVLARRALTVDPDNPRAYADLGTHLLRTGDESAARAALERAFADDPFDQTIFNQLALLDTLDTFVTITEGKIVMRLHPEEAGVMREYAMPLAQEALATLERQYEFTATGPILIEMFPKHDDFAVRTIGLPGFIGALGACFGRVVTLDSPRARDPGDFSWEETLWHEIAHVITLQMSDNRLPRWLSEGVSVWEERRARSEWGREMDVPFAQALGEDKILAIEVLNEGFSDPELISLSYHQASLVVDHIVDTYGEAGLWRLIRAYGRGLETGAAVMEALGVSLDQMQVGFDARLEKQYAGLLRALQTPTFDGEPTLEELGALAKSNPQSFAVQMRLAVAWRGSGDAAAAIRALERAADLVPSATGANNPHRMIAAIAAERKDTTRTIDALEALLRVDHADVESARQLAALVAPLGDARRTESAYRRVVSGDPFDRDAQAALGRLALARTDTATALRAFRSALAGNPPDLAQAHADLAEALITSGQRGEAKTQVLAALEIAPAFERAQDLLLRLVEP